MDAGETDIVFAVFLCKQAETPGGVLRKNPPAKLSRRRTNWQSKKKLGSGLKAMITI